MSKSGSCLIKHGKSIDHLRIKKEANALIADIPRMSRETAMMKVANGILAELKTQERSVLFSSSSNKTGSKDVVVDDDLLSSAIADTRKSAHRFTMESDSQGVLPGKIRQLDREIKNGEITENDISNGWNNTRNLIRSKYGDNVTLYRVNPPESQHNKDTVTLYYGDKQLAKRFETEDQKAEPFNINVDDILALYARPSGYYEFIVKKDVTNSVTSPKWSGESIIEKFINGYVQKPGTGKNQLFLFVIKNKQDYINAIDMYFDGETIDAISNKLGKNPDKLAKSLRLIGVDVAPHAISTDTIEKLADEYKSGKTISSLAKEFKIDKGAISRHLQNIGLKTSLKINNETISNLIDEYNKGSSIRALSKAYKLDHGAITRHFRSRGIDTSTGLTDGQRKDAVTYYMNKESPESIARIMGFSSQAIRNSLIGSGVKLRNQSESSSLRLQKYGPSFKANKIPFQSEKNSKWLIADSTFEIARFIELENNINVKAYTKNIKPIPYDNGARNYSPDILVTYKDGTKVVEEIKSSWQLTYANKMLDLSIGGIEIPEIAKLMNVSESLVTGFLRMLRKIDAAISHYEKLGIDYKIITEEEISAEAFKESNYSSITKLSSNERRAEVASRRKVNDDVLFSFAGENAIGINQYALSIAQERLANGEDAETVRQDTGWHKSVDGKYKFEISDREAKTQKDFIDGDDTIAQIYNGVINKRGMGRDSEIFVGDIIQHPKLFAAYPSLQTIPVYLQSGKGGGYSSKHNILLLGEDSKIADIKSIVLHELQHAIQAREGFSTGGSPNAFKVDDFETQLSKAYSDFVKEHPEVKALGVVAKKMGKDSREYKDYQAKLKELGWAKKQAELSGFDKYQRLAGEVEARNTQARALFSEDHRKFIPPSETADVKDENVIVSWNGKEIASMVGDDNSYQQDGIRFSVSSPQDLFDDAATIPPATYKDIIKKLSFTGDKARSLSKELGLSAFTQRQLTQIGEEILPILKKMGVERNNYDVEESTWHNMADKIANRWERLAPDYKRFDKQWRHRNKLEQMRIASIMHEMTVSGVDPRKPEPIPNSKNAEAILMYQKLKPEYDKLLPNTKALLNDIEKFHGDVIKALVESLADKINASEMPAEKKEKLIKDIEDKFKTKKGPYFPLMRFGDYWVDYDGGVQMFVTKKEQSDFIKQAKKDGVTVNGYGKSLQNFNKIEGVDVGFVDDVSQLIDTLDIEQSEALKDGIFQLYLTALPETSMRKRFIHRKKTPGWEQDALKSFAKKAFHDGKQLAKLRHAPAMRKVLQDAEEIVKIGNSSKQKGQLQRRIALIPKLMEFMDNTGNPEFDRTEYKDLYGKFEDAADQRVIRRFERFTQESERNEAMSTYLEQQQALLKSVNDYQAKGDKSETAADIIKALHKSYANMMESNTSSLTNFINQGVFTYFLGFNPASAVINYFQTPGVALPLVAGRHGFVKSSKALADATRLFFTNKHTEDDSLSIQGGLTDAGEKQMYQTLTANGTFDRTRSHDLAGLSEEGIDRGTLHRDIMNASTFMFHKAEVANREITALMAYRMEFAKTGNISQSIQYANDVVNDAHLDYSSANRPDAFQGNFARVAFQFKMYSQGMTFLWGKAAYDALIAKDVSPERKAEAKNILLSLIGVQTAMAGVLGLPIGGILLAAQALAGLGDDDDDPVDVELEIRKSLNAVFGNDIGRILARGALSETGADFAGRLSLSDLWIREPDRELEGKDKAYYLLKTIAGPAAGILEDVLSGMKLIDEGNTDRGIEKMLPHSVSGMAKAYRMMDEGGATSLTGNLIYETSAYEKMIQAVGMRPSGLAEQQLQNSAIKNREAAIGEAKSKLINRVALSKMNGDNEAYQAAMADIKDWNIKYAVHPKLRITPQTIGRSIRSRKEAQRNSVNGIVSRKAYDFIRDEEDINEK